MTVRRKQTATILPQGKGAPEPHTNDSLGLHSARPTSGSACRNLRVKRQRISEGSTILTPISAVHSHKKGGWKRYEKTELKELYQMMFPDYPDIVTVKQLCEMLGVSRALAYKLISDDEIQAVKIGTSLKIPKVSVINYVTEEKKEVRTSA